MLKAGPKPAPLPWMNSYQWTGFMQAFKSHAHRINVIQPRVQQIPKLFAGGRPRGAHYQQFNNDFNAKRGLRVRDRR